MANRFPTMRQTAQQAYIPEDNPEAMAAQQAAADKYNELMAPYRGVKRDLIQSTYDKVMRETGDERAAMQAAQSVASRIGRTELVAETGAAVAAPGAIASGAGRTVNAARDVLAGVRGRNAMTPAEMLAAEPRALPPPAAGPSSPVGRGVSGEPIPGTSAERLPRVGYEPYKPDVRSVPDELAMFEGEGGATADSIAEARRLARERIAAERAFREQQLATMEGEGGGAQAAGEARARRAAADQAAMEAAINAAENEGMGAAVGAGRRAPATGRDVVPMGNRDVVPARTPGTDLQALMDRHFGGGGGGGRNVTNYEFPLEGEIIQPGSNVSVMGGGRGGFGGGAGAGGRGPGQPYASLEDWLAAHPDRAARSWEAEGIPAWLKYGAPIGAGVAGGTYLASGNSRDTGQMQGPPMPPTASNEPPAAAIPSQTDRALQLVGAMPIQTAYGDKSLGFGAFNKPAAAAAPTAQQPGRDYAPLPPTRDRSESRGFLDRLIGQPSQSMGGNLVQDGKINWGSGESAADFVRASQAMRKMQEEGQEVRGINPQLEMDPSQRKSGGSVGGDKTLEKALSIIHHLVKR